MAVNNKRTPAIAVDLGSHSLKVLCLKRDGQAMALEGAVMPLESQDAVTSAHAIREILGRLGVSPSGNLVVSSTIGGAECVAQVVDLPPLEDSEVAQAAQFEGKKICPVAGEALTVAHQVLGRNENPAGVRTLISAVPESIFKRHIRLLEDAGLEPMYVEPATLALANVAAAHEAQAGGLVLDIGHQATTLVVLLSDGRLFSRRIEPGGNDFTGALMHHFGIAATAAEDLKHRVGLGSVRTGDSREAAEAAATLARVADQLVFELRRSLTFAETLPGFPQGFTHVTLCGGAASMPGLGALLSKTLGVGVRLLDPLEGRNVNWRGSDDPGARAVFAQAMGLMERWL